MGGLVGNSRGKRHIRCGALAILLIGTAACGTSTSATNAVHRAVVTTSTTVPGTTSTTAPVAVVAPGKNALAHLGETFVLMATLPSATPPETAIVKATLDRVTDPAPGSPYGDPTPPAPHNRWVELRFTLSNAGNMTVPAYQGDEYILSLEGAVNQINAFEGFPPPSMKCGEPVGGNVKRTGLNPGESTTGCVAVELPIGVPVVNASVTLLFSGDGIDGATGEWMVH
jgi:hypothetical protein